MSAAPRDAAAELAEAIVALAALEARISALQATAPLIGAAIDGVPVDKGFYIDRNDNPAELVENGFWMECGQELGADVIRDTAPHRQLFTGADIHAKLAELGFPEAARLFSPK